MLSSKIKELIKIPYFKLKNYLLLKEYGKRYEEKEILENRIGPRRMDNAPLEKDALSSKVVGS